MCDGHHLLHSFEYWRIYRRWNYWVYHLTTKSFHAKRAPMNVRLSRKIPEDTFVLLSCFWKRTLGRFIPEESTSLLFCDDARAWCFRRNGRENGCSVSRWPVTMATTGRICASLFPRVLSPVVRWHWYWRARENLLSSTCSVCIDLSSATSYCLRQRRSLRTSRFRFSSSILPRIANNLSPSRQQIAKYFWLDFILTNMYFLRNGQLWFSW